MRAGLLLAIAATACGGAGGNEGASTNQIVELSTPGNLIDDVSATARLEPLSQEDLAGLGAAGGCVLGRGGRVFLAAVGSDAVARVDDELRHFVASGPVGPTGGFFEERQVSISIGRDARGAARAAVTNRRTGARERWTGTWTCGGRTQ